MTSSRPFLPVFLLFLGTLAMLYQFVPLITSSLSTSLRNLPIPHLSSSCTKDIGDGLCCDLFLGAEPCIEQCREKFVDRETWTLTNEYDECADRCLVVYKGSCAGREGEKRRGLVGEQDVEGGLEKRGDLFERGDDDFAVEGGAGVEGPNAVP
ncbi:hypothetical protein K458DRAFT_408702 [Lentithecium fluviatile CBS 122367]|uniref:Uncharacterized protein n=1 Tax=Lentithecium fluviatile CBS 122367 TaxID=1168545 RepID=A0A6G1IKL6_9PLEO|nr:hypothetical protein K458DRAFT_408702 [Lentithecium fluviatile CBS 122367]